MAYVEVEVNLCDIHDDDLIDEMQDRGFLVIRGELGDVNEFKELYKDYKAYGFTEKFQKILEDFFEDINNG